MARAFVIDPVTDRRYVLGGLLASVALTALVVTRGDVAPAWWIWVVALDGPHIFATLARTYLDPGERRDRARLLWGSLAWFAVGPATLVVSALAHTQLPTVVFLTVAYLWAYWHVVRQHLGFVALYRRAGRELDPAGDRRDRTALYVGTIGPFLAFALYHPEARAMLGLTGPPTWEPWVEAVLWAGTVGTLATWLVLAPDRGSPKVAYLLATAGWSMLVFSPLVASRLPLGAVALAVTAWHNVQYHAIVRFWQRNRYAKAAPAHPWLATLAGYWIAGIAFTLAYRIPQCLFGATPGCSAAPGAVFAGFDRATVAQVFFWGPALHHYFVDQYIWRPSRDASLRANLKIA
jgi:hypothetical protein